MPYVPPKRYENAAWEHVPEAIRAIVLEKPDSVGLFLHGGAGTGKTHIAWAIALHVYREKLAPDQPVFYNSAELLDQIRDSFGTTKQNPVKEMGLDRRLTIIDDLGAEKMNDWTAEQFYRLINSRYDHVLPTIFTSNLDTKGIADNYGERIASRISELCQVIELEGSDRRTSVPVTA